MRFHDHPHYNKPVNLARIRKYWKLKRDEDLRLGKTKAERRKKFYAWIKFMKTHPEKVWRKEQNKIVLGYFKKVRKIGLTAREYLVAIGEGDICER